MSVEYTEWPTHYSFPPFFTLQPNKETQVKQLSIWIQFIKDYCEKTRQFALDKSHSVFTNQDISRSFSQEGITAVFAEMVGTSQGEYIDQAQKDRIYVWWQSKETWAKKLLTHAEKTGLLNSVATVYELINDNPDFLGMDETMLVKILKVLQPQGKCELMSGAGGAIEGVKFFM